MCIDPTTKSSPSCNIYYKTKLSVATGGKKSVVIKNTAYHP